MKGWVFVKFHWVPVNCLFEKLSRLVSRDRAHQYPNCGDCKESVEHALSRYPSYDTQREFLDHGGMLVLSKPL